MKRIGVAGASQAAIDGVLPRPKGGAGTARDRANRVDGPTQREQFTALFRPHLDIAYRTALSLTKHVEDAEDLVQDTYLRAYQTLVRQPGLPIRNPRAWLLTVLRRLFIDRYRRNLRLPELDGDRVDQAPTEILDPEREFWAAYTYEALQDAMGELPEDFRIVFHTVVVEGMTYREASEIAQCGIGTVMSRVHRSKAVIRRQLAGLI